MPNMKLKLFKNLGILIAVSMPLQLPSAVLAADAYPSKPLRLIVPNAPGGGVDLFGRLFAPKLSERLGKQVVVDNRGGGGGVIGTEIVARAESNGYTLLFTNATHTVLPALQKLPYDSMKSFTPIARLVSAPNTLFVNPSVPANSVKDLIALAKQKPGQLVFGSAGMGSGNHLNIELFKIMAGIDFKIVHFKGAGPAMIDLLGGHIHAYIASLSLVLPYVKSGKVRMLGSGGLKRSDVLPDVPTIAEAGLPGYEVNNWYGILAPAGTPAPIGDRLNKELKVILTLDDVKKWLVTNGAEVDYLDPTEFGSFLEREMTKWADVAKKANIKLDGQM